ncbi:Protein krueppel [Gryllus bimaculatus]|nr:Protein krueppel [Gryllus bimaculatus]
MIFPCGMCNFVFPNRYTLHKHFLDDHNIDKSMGRKLFKCPHCEKKFTRNTNLKIHVMTFHKKAAPALATCQRSSFVTLGAAREHQREAHKGPKSDEARPQRRVSCIECKEQFSDRSTMYRHFRRRHKDIKLQTHTVPMLSCPECPQYFSRYTELQTHLTTLHGIEIASKTLRFSSLREFEIWKSQEEANSLTNFIKRSSNKKFTYYICDISSKVRNVSGMGNEGYTTRMGKCCPARIVLRKEGNDYYGSFFSTHVGHTHSIDSLNLTLEESSRLLAE